jgi:hypothetical protein
MTLISPATNVRLSADPKTILNEISFRVAARVLGSNVRIFEGKIKPPKPIHCEYTCVCSPIFRRFLVRLSSDKRTAHVGDSTSFQPSGWLIVMRPKEVESK